MPVKLPVDYAICLLFQLRKPASPSEIRRKYAIFSENKGIAICPYNTWGLVTGNFIKYLLLN